jgi:hypothetical protein
MRWDVIGFGVVAGCGPRALDDVGGEGGGSGDSTILTAATSTSTSADPGGTTCAPQMDEPSNDATGAPSSVCDPQPEALTLEVLIDGLENYDQPEGEQLHDCVIESISESIDGAVEIAFDCVDSEKVGVEHTLSIVAQPSIALPFEEGDVVVFDLWTTVPW